MFYTKPKMSMNKNHILIPFLIFIMSIGDGFDVAAQKPTELSFSIYPGFTLVNFEKALGYADDYMEDWDQFHLALAARGFLKSNSPLQIGGEFGWQQLYYAYYIVPYGTQRVYREFYISTISLTALARISTEHFFIAGGPGIHVFHDGIAPAVSMELGMSVNLGEKIAVPLSIRLDPIFGDGIPTALSIGIGAAYKFSATKTTKIVEPSW